MHDCRAGVASFELRHHGSAQQRVRKCPELTFAVTAANGRLEPTAEVPKFRCERMQRADPPKTTRCIAQGNAAIQTKRSISEVVASDIADLLRWLWSGFAAVVSDVRRVFDAVAKNHEDKERHR